MGTDYTLVNFTKKQRISFCRLPAGTAREIAGTPSASAVVSWYLLNNRGDQIAFVPDTGDEWPFSTGCTQDLSDYEEVTDNLVAELISEGILVDCGYCYVDSEDPTIHCRDLRNSWMPAEMLAPKEPCAATRIQEAEPTAPGHAPLSQPLSTRKKP